MPATSKPRQTEKKPRRRAAVPLDRLVDRSREQLSDIARKLEQDVFPISDARGQHLAYAITAIRLGQGLLRDVGDVHRE